MLYYTILEFSRAAQTTPRTIRFYIKKELLKSEYDKTRNITVLSEKEFITLQIIDLLKSAHFTLKEIKFILENNNFKERLTLQKNILLKQIAQNHAMLEMIEHIENSSEDSPQDYLKLYHHHLKDHHYKQQFLDTSPLDIRIRFHERYNTIKPEWFLWLFEQYQFNAHDCVLEVACGQGTLWRKNQKMIPPDISITLTDLSDKMIASCMDLLSFPQIKEVKTADVHHLPFPDNTFNIVIANHLFMYFNDLDHVLKEIARVLKPNGRLYASTISQYHNLELESLLKQFNARANMGQKQLTDQFSLENGEEKLSYYFKNIRQTKRQIPYLIDDPEMLSQYIYSTRWIGNIQEILDDRYNDFKSFVEKELLKHGCFKTTNYSGQFIATVKK
ncbi:MerR family transcriptional regulator [Beduini massiliensis]|uniref:MerR family transcriptional regulator n=1 Tax=Beduini massiliensis TaxID=1585974 RepID=UPI00059AA873|nr:methyltransferase domain-containing protein [Beduini massiliensis]